MVRISEGLLLTSPILSTQDMTHRNAWTATMRCGMHILTAFQAAFEIWVQKIPKNEVL